MFDLRESLGDTMKSFALRAHQRGLELACFIHPDVPRVVVGDYNRLRQIVVNLVGNAIKFTEKGEVSLEVTAGSRVRRRTWLLHFTVSDTGIGIPEEKRATIFEMFEQADSSTHAPSWRNGAGAGHRLAAGAPDGRADLGGKRSRPGKPLPLHRPPPPGRKPSPPKPLPPSPSVCTGCGCWWSMTTPRTGGSSKRSSRSWSMLPTSAADAGEGHAAHCSRRTQAGEPYRLVVTDAHMPARRRLHAGRADQAGRRRSAAP